MKISVIGCGRWGTFIAWYLDKIGHQVILYGRETSRNMEMLKKTRTNGTITLSETINLECNIENVLKSDVIVISISSQGLRELLGQVAQFSPENKCFVLCMKGIEISTNKRLSEVAEEYIGKGNSVAVWLGPGHVEDYYQGIPNCMVIDSKSEQTKKKLVDMFSSELIRFYYGSDLIGNEIGAAAKNVIGIGAGMLDGLKLTPLKGALMARGTHEVAHLIKALGGDEISAYGLCHLGDYEATVFSEHSHNRKFGESVVNGIEYNQLAEGYYTAQALHNLSELYAVDMPICNAIYDILYKKAVPEETIKHLFLRTLKREFA